MSNSFRTTFTVDRSAQQTFDAINDVRSWWAGQVEGHTDRLGEEFDYTVPGVHYSRQRVVDLEPARRVAWLVVDSRLEYLEDQHEWNGTTISFDLVERGGGTEVTFTHQGLVPDFECYDGCSSFWASVVLPSLRERLAERVPQA